MCKRSKIALLVSLLCLTLSGCTAHSIKNNIHVVVCVQCVN
ncbi:hypothetical protein [Acinetobacter phage vB_AbaM_BP10]|nr:hypothetical protein [Acinetobacter phage vB_AbaM_BP10]